MLLILSCIHISKTILRRIKPSAIQLFSCVLSTLGVWEPGNGEDWQGYMFLIHLYPLHLLLERILHGYRQGKNPDLMKPKACGIWEFIETRAQHYKYKYRNKSSSFIGFQ
jgi:hypothetical protein